MLGFGKRAAERRLGSRRVTRACPARACAVPAPRASRPGALRPPVPGHAGHRPRAIAVPSGPHRPATGPATGRHPANRQRPATGAPAAATAHMHADAEAGQRHQDHGQPVLEPLRQHFRPPQQGRQHRHAGQTPAQPMDATALRPRTTTALATSAAAAVAGSSVSAVAASSTPSTAQTQPGGSARAW